VPQASPGASYLPPDNLQPVSFLQAQMPIWLGVRQLALNNVNHKRISHHHVLLRSKAQSSLSFHIVHSSRAPVVGSNVQRVHVGIIPVWILSSHPSLASLRPISLRHEFQGSPVWSLPAVNGYVALHPTNHLQVPIRSSCECDGHKLAFLGCVFRMYDDRCQVAA
jgi:hypothetical protein